MSMPPDPPLAEVGDWPDPAPPNAADLIALASERIRDHCGWQISARADDVVELDYDGRGLLPVPSARITAVAALEADGVTVTPTMYDWYADGLIVLRWRRFLPGPRRFTLTYSHGYDPVPLAVTSATVTVAGQMEANPLGANSVRVGDVSVTYGDGKKVSGLAVLTSVDAALAPYRIPRGWA